MAAVRPGQLADTLRALDPDAQCDRLEGGHMADGEVIEAHWHGPCASWIEFYAAPDLTGWGWDEPDAHAAFEDLVLTGMPLLEVCVTSIDWLA